MGSAKGLAGGRPAIIGLIACALSWTNAAPAAAVDAPLPTTGVDEHTIALWLFDETPYFNVTLTDAGPLHLDLRLATGRAKPLPDSVREGRRGLLPGRFGRALYLPLGGGAGVSWAEGGLTEFGTTRMLDRGDEVPEVCNLGYLDYTLEFWFKADGEQTGPAVIWEVRNQDNRNPLFRSCASGYNALVLDAGRTRFLLCGEAHNPNGRGVNWSQRLEIPTDRGQLADGQWHHLAFTYSAGEHQMRHYFDGKLQPRPQPGGFLPLMGQLVSMTLGRAADGSQELVGALDEFRISDIVRYPGEFRPPESFSVNFGPRPPAPAQPDGPPLLFAGQNPAEPVPLGSRRHLFIDDALIARMDENVRFTPNPPGHMEATDFRNTRAWEPTPRMGAAIPDICSFWQDGERIGMLYSNNGHFGAKDAAVCYAYSHDGLHWEKPDLGLHEWNRSTHNNIVLRNALQGTAIRDPNPAEPPERRYKMLAWLMTRGFYVLTSPDGLHWQRNEACAFPFDPDGSCDIFWDDQAGVYRAYLRSLENVNNPKVLRGVVRAKTTEVLKPWPIQPAPMPTWHMTGPDQTWPLPKPSSGELPVVDTGGEVYRMKAVKYPLAPDVYLAFPWRYRADKNVRPGSLMMVSRDGEHWRRYETPFYFAAGGDFGGRRVQEALMEEGMIAHGDEIWQYGTLRFTEHGGALYGGVEHDGTGFDQLMRLTQRLDGFVSLDAGATAGTVVTRPLTFAGNKLELNVAARGRVRIALLDAQGRPLPGFGLEECDPIRTDSVHQIVSWKGRTGVGRHAGQPVQVQFELQEAKLYAFQFVP